MKKISYNENPSPWNNSSINAKVKVASLNCSGLVPHFNDVMADEKLRKADILHLVETSLVNTKENAQLSIPGYELIGSIFGSLLFDK